MSKGGNKSKPTSEDVFFWNLLHWTFDSMADKMQGLPVISETISLIM